MSKFIDLTGQRYNRLVVIKYLGKSCWLCKCDCGNETKVYTTYIKNGRTKSCGCLSAELSSLRNRTHGNTETRLYNTWMHLKQRCNNKNSKDYCNYGGRGIKVCDEWLGENGFINFYEWSIKNCYNEKLTIDRINNNGDYEPSNCRWATKKEQNNNTRKNHFYLIDGEYLTIAQVARKYNINYNTLNNRLWHGDSIENAIIKINRKTGNEL